MIRIDETHINKSINQFIQNIDKGPFKHLKYAIGIEEQSKYIEKKEKKDIYQCAVAQAWLDMCRTTDGDKDNAIKSFFSEKLKGVFEEENSPKAEDLIYCTEEPANKLTVGQRQKIVNMACKYLYCCKDLRSNEVFIRVFKTAHMPLDSYTLDWFVRVVVPWCIETKKEFPGDKKSFVKGNMCEWSKLNETDKKKDIFTIGNEKYYSYSFYQTRINEYIESNIESKDLSPLEVEFIVWPEIQLLVATESFIFSINKYSSGKKKTIREIHSIKRNIETITEHIEDDHTNLLWFK